MGRSLERAIILLHFLSEVIYAELEYQCKESRCSDQGPAIRFPFRLKGHQEPADRCGYPGFDLYCNERNQTVLNLTPALELSVKTIFYESQEIQLYDPQDCLAKTLQNLDLSASPFQTPYIGGLAMFNCSSTIVLNLPVTCLDVPGYHVYAVFNDSSVFSYPLVSCTKIPVSLPDNIFYGNEVQLKWATPICGICEEKGMKCRFKKKNSTQLETECFKPPKDAAAAKRFILITGVVLGFILLVVVFIVLYRVRNSNKLEKEHQVKVEKFLEDYKALKPTRYSYADIKRITNKFKEKLGQGGYGTVFKGKLSNEILVAVKILNNSKGNGDEFINEVGTMGTIHHVNVVRLVGFCADGFRRALVYEFLPNESLEKYIFSADRKERFLGWERLQDIVLGIAKGIEYLHEGCDRQILHFDIKPHNILLDHNFNPKISDFGLAKLCSKDQSAVSMTAARGTMGYIAPEVLSRNFGNVSCKSDVYSFGMLLLEMVGGRKNIHADVESTSQVNFPKWVYDHLNQGQEVEIRIEEEKDAKIAKKLTLVGLWCIQWYPVDRPSMKVVIQMLEGLGNKVSMPPNPFGFTIQNQVKCNHA